VTGIRALGIDVGSTTVKIVGVDAKGNMVWQMLEQAEPRIEEQERHRLEIGVSSRSKSVGNRLASLRVTRLIEFLPH